MFFHVFLLFPETAGKTLEETEYMFEDPSGPKYIGTLAWKTKTNTKHIIALEHGDIEKRIIPDHAEETVPETTETKEETA
jgi:hypothetical protein